MKKFTFVDKLTGQITNSGTSADPYSHVSDTERVVLDVVYSNGWLNKRNKYFPIPTCPSEHHVFDWNTKAWIDTRTEQTQWTVVKNRRNALLLGSDWVVTKSTETGTPIPQAWIDYRQALRDITNQADPFNIVWPTKPS